MANKNIILSTSSVSRQKGVVVLPLEKWRKMEKENRELRMATEAILSGELAFKNGKTRSFKEFLKEEFHAKNK